MKKCILMAKRYGLVEYVVGDHSKQKTPAGVHAGTAAVAAPTTDEPLEVHSHLQGTDTILGAPVRNTTTSTTSGDTTVHHHHHHHGLAKVPQLKSRKSLKKKTPSKTKRKKEPYS